MQVYHVRTAGTLVQIIYVLYCPRYLMYDGDTDSLLKPAGGG